MNKISTLLTSAGQKWQKCNLMWRITAGIFIGATLALLLPNLNGIALLGTLFVGALKAVAPVLVFVLVMASVSKARAGLGSRFSKVISLYLATTLAAAVLAVLASHLFPVSIVLTQVESAEDAAPGALSDVFRNIVGEVMSNPITAIGNANYLSILFWAIIIGLALKKLAGSDTLRMVNDGAEAISLVVKWIIQCAPFGIMGLVYSAVSESGLEIFTTYGKLLLLLVGCMSSVALVLNPPHRGLPDQAQPLSAAVDLPPREWPQCVLHPLVGSQHPRQHGSVQTHGCGRRLLLGEHSAGQHHQHERCGCHHHGDDAGHLPHHGAGRIRGQRTPAKHHGLPGRLWRFGG